MHLVLAAVLACADPPPPPALATLAACPDPACALAAAPAAWATDPAGTTAWLAARPDAGQRQALVTALGSVDPAAPAVLCPAVLAERKEDCMRRAARPHLHQRQAAVPASASGAPALADPRGPRSATLPVPALDPAWPATPPAGCALPCAAAPGLARERARAGATAAALGGLCRAGDPDRAAVYDECLFRAAEALAGRGRPEERAAAWTLCRASAYRADCAAHLVTAGVAVPAADRVQDTDVADAARTAAALGALDPEDPALGPLLEGFFWATWLGTAFGEARAVDGGLLDRLPPAAAPHVRAGAAWHRVQAGVHAPLATLVTQLAADLARRAPPAPPRPPQRARLLLRRDAWPRVLPAEADLQTTWMLGPGRRATAADPTVDLALCLLEAAAQLPTPPPATWFAAVVGDPAWDPRVRWTGARLARALDPDLALPPDPDPLVQARGAPPPP